VIKASGIYMVGRALAALLTIASVAIFSRVLAPGDYGFYTLTITTSALFNALFCTWVAQSVFRFYAEQDPVRLQSTGLFALALSGAVSVAGALTVILLSGKPVTAELAAGMLMLFTGYSVYEYCNILLSLRRQPQLFVQLQVARLFLTMALPLAAFLLLRRFDHFMLALGIAYWLPLLLPRFLFWARGASLASVDRELLGAMARYGLPLSLSILLVQLGTSLDRYILGAKQGVDVVAGYAAGADLALFSIGMMASSLSQAYYPQLLQLHAEGRDEDQRKLYGQFMLLFTGLLLPAAVGLHFVSGEVATLITGKAIRADAVLSLAVFTATAFFLNFKSFIVDPRFQIAKQMKLPIFNAWVMVGTLVAGCFLLIPTCGAIGAAWASLISAFTGAALALLLSTRMPGRLPFPAADLSKLAIATVAMAAVLYGLGNWLRGDAGWVPALLALGVRVLAGLSAYALALILLRFRPALQVLERVAALRGRG
jgi:O-antigen/teichoic acid export membrane protein